jgi:hypothetical protein
MLQVPFSTTTRDLVLEKLSDMNFVQELCDEMYNLFKVISYFLLSTPILHSLGILQWIINDRDKGKFSTKEHKTISIYFLQQIKQKIVLDMWYPVQP